MASERQIFVDANVFVALLNKDDALHERATALWSRLKEEGAVIVTTNMVVSEVITVISQRAGKALAMEFAQTVYGGGDDFVVVYSDAAVEGRALEYFRAIRSKNVSFVDAIILATMERMDIRRLASFDHIFRRQKGIELFA